MVEKPGIVLVGQTPPPVHGQALAIQRLVSAPFTHITVHHVPMNFSDSMADVGRLRPGKVLRLMSLIWRVLRTRSTTHARILYYPPAGPTLVPVLRDLLFLTLVRPFFPALVLDLHAGGLADMEHQLPAPLRPLFRHAYHDADLVIERYINADCRLPSRRRVVVPYGIEDEFRRWTGVHEEKSGFTVLFVGLVAGTKGIWTLIEALGLLHEKGVDTQAVVVGEFGSNEDAAKFAELLRRHGIEDRVRHAGKLVGAAKWHEFRRADVFCFPSHYENEALPIAIIEAMQFCLPVVASDWRGIPHLVRDGVTGFVVRARDPTAVADRLKILASNAEMRDWMGKKARKVFLESYTVGAYLAAMENALLSVAAPEN